MRTLDIISALVILALSALVGATTWELPYWTTFAPGPAFAPVWTAIAGAVIGVSLLVQAIRAPADVPAGWPDRTGMRQVLLGIASIWLLFAILPLVGTTVGGFIFVLGFLLIIGRRPLLPSLLTSVITVGIIESVFVLWLGIDLPTGLIGF